MRKYIKSSPYFIVALTIFFGALWGGCYCYDRFAEPNTKPEAWMQFPILVTSLLLMLLGVIIFILGMVIFDLTDKEDTNGNH